MGKALDEAGHGVLSGPCEGHVRRRPRCRVHGRVPWTEWQRRNKEGDDEDGRDAEEPDGPVGGDEPCLRRP